MDDSLKSKLARLATAQATDVDKTEASASFGLPLLQWFNETPLHAGTLIKGGGWGIQKTESFIPPPIGPIQQIKHMTGSASMQAVTNKPLRMSVLWVTKPYVRWFVNGRDNPAQYIEPEFLFDRMDMKVAANLGLKSAGDAESGISVFVALEADPERRVYEIPVKTYCVEDWRRILKLVTISLSSVSKYFSESFEGWPKGQIIPIYSQWISVGVGGTSLEGGGKQGAVTHPELLWPGIDMPLEELWMNHAARKNNSEKKAMVCDADSQWSFLRDKVSIEGLVHNIPDDADIELFENKRQELLAKINEGFRAILPATPDGIKAALTGSQLLSLPAPQDNDMGDGPAGESQGAVQNDAEAAKQTVGQRAASQGYINQFFGMVREQVNLTPKAALTALGVTTLNDVDMTEEEALDKLRAASAKPAAA